MQGQKQSIPKGKDQLKDKAKKNEKRCWTVMVSTLQNAVQILEDLLHCPQQFFFSISYLMGIT